MRDAERLPKPEVLESNEAQWLEDYLEALDEGDTKKISYRRGKYGHEDVRNTLNEMYRNLCCYCEGEVGAVGADQIEHRKPVSLFPGHTFDWVNLHLACAKCNRAKSNKWDNDTPVLDAVDDVPVSDHLGYVVSETGVRRTYDTERGHTTITHTGLNREKLREERARVFNGVLGLIIEINRKLQDDPDNIEAGNRILDLKDKCTGRYGTMIRWAMMEFLDADISWE